MKKYFTIAAITAFAAVCAAACKGTKRPAMPTPRLAVATAVCHWRR